MYVTVRGGPGCLGVKFGPSPPQDLLADHRTIMVLEPACHVQTTRIWVVRWYFCVTTIRNMIPPLLRRQINTSPYTLSSLITTKVPEAHNVIMSGFNVLEILHLRWFEAIKMKVCIALSRFLIKKLKSVEI